MIPNPKIFIDNSPMSPGPSVTVKNPSAIKSLRIFTEVLDEKNKSSVYMVGAAKSNQKAIISGSILWSSIPKRRGHTEIYEQVKKYPYNCILQYLQVVQYPIVNDCLQVYIYGHCESQLVPKLLL